MKKKLICILAVLLLVTSCGKVPKLKNGDEAVVTIKDGDISVEELYSEMKEKYALDMLITKIDTAILNNVYKTDDEEKNSRFKLWFRLWLYFKSSLLDFALCPTLNLRLDLVLGLN